MRGNRIQSLMIRKIQYTIDKFNMLEKGDKVLIAFSGGPDSSVLLYLLNELKGKYGISLYAGHVNHMLRGKESLSDEREVKKRCEELKIPCRTVRKNVKKFKKQGESTEEAARRVRYEALAKIAKTFGVNKIALGHNRDDQVETVLLRIIRGTGEAGLRGIPKVRNLVSDIKIIRPLIEIKRKEIEGYLKLKKIKPQIDSSNLDLNFLRNRVRHKLIPYLEKYNPKIKDSLLRIAKISEENSEYIRQNTHKILKEISTHLPGAMRIDLNKLLVYPRVLHSHIIREAIKKFRGEFKNLNYSNLEEIEKIINSRRANLVLWLSSGIEIVKEYQSLFIRKGRCHKTSTCKNDYYYVFKGRGKFYIPEIRKTFHIDYIKKNDKTYLKFDDSSLPALLRRKQMGTIYFDADEIKFPLILRTREKGDLFLPFGMKGCKKLKDFFIDKKVPLQERNKIPILITADGKILWIVGYRRSNLGIIAKGTSRIMRIKLSDEKNT